MGVVDLALHIEHRDAARLGDVPDVAVAHAPVHVADRDPVVVAAEDLADLLRRVAVGDLGRPALDELGVPAELSHSRLERGARARAREEEQHGEDLVPQERVGNAEGTLALQVEGDVEQRVDLVLRPFLQGDEVASAKVSLHWFTPLLRVRGIEVPSA